MNNPVGWFEIVRYADFFDFPRYILACDESGAHWIFDGAFDDETDEYSDHFIYVRLGRDRDAAMQDFLNSTSIPRAADRSRYASIPLSRLGFDETRRTRMHVAPG